MEDIMIKSLSKIATKGRGAPSAAQGGIGTKPSRILEPEIPETRAAKKMTKDMNKMHNLSESRKLRDSQK